MSDLEQKNELLSNALTLRMIGQNNFKRCMLIEGKKKDKDIDNYIKILKIFEKDTFKALKGQFKFIK